MHILFNFFFNDVYCYFYNILFLITYAHQHLLYLTNKLKINVNYKLSICYF